MDAGAPPAPPKLVTVDQQTDQFRREKQQTAVRIAELEKIVAVCTTTRTHVCGLPKNEVCVHACMHAVVVVVVPLSLVIKTCLYELVLVKPASVFYERVADSVFFFEPDVHLNLLLSDVEFGILANVRQMLNLGD